MLLTLKGHEGRLTQAIFSPDGQQIYSIDDANILRIWATATPSQIASWDKRDEAGEEEGKREKKTRASTLDANLGPSVSAHLYVDQLNAAWERKDAQTTRKIWRDLVEVTHRRAQELRDPWVLPRIIGEVFDQVYVLAHLTGPITPESDCRVYPITTQLHDASTPVPMTAYFRKGFRVEDPTAARGGTKPLLTASGPG